jgi:serine/threonine-protein kinase
VYHDWDWSAADAEFQRALVLNPNSARAHGWYSIFLTLMGRTQEALEESNRALSLDPLSVVTRADAGLTYYFTRQFDKAIEQYRRTLEIDPSFAVAYLPLGGALEQKRLYDSALVAFTNASMYSEGHPIAVAAMGHCYAMAGRPDDAQSMLELLLQKYPAKPHQSYWVGPYWIALIYSALGDIEHGFDWLDRAYKERDGSLVFINVDPGFINLHHDQRFEKLLEKLSFPVSRRGSMSSGSSLN